MPCAGGFPLLGGDVVALQVDQLGEQCYYKATPVVIILISIGLTKGIPPEGKGPEAGKTSQVNDALTF